MNMSIDKEFHEMKRTLTRAAFDNFASIAKENGFCFERTGGRSPRYELFSNERALGTAAEYDTLDEAHADIWEIKNGGNPLTIE